MKFFIQKTILYSFYAISLAESASEANHIIYLKKARLCLSEVILVASEKDFDDYKSSTNPLDLQTKEEAELQSNLRTIPAGCVPLLEFAKRSPQAALIAYAEYRGSATWDPETTPSPTRLFAGFAHIPCNRERANKLLAEKYLHAGIDPSYQIPFEEADEAGLWKELPLPDFCKTTRKSSSSSCCFIQ